MRVLYDIEDMLEDELKKIAKQDSLTGSDVECVYKVVDILKDISTIRAMDEVGFDGYSKDYSYDEPWPYVRGNVSMRGRDSMGRYSSRDSYRDGYSTHGSKDEIIKHLREMMEDARSDEEREKYRRAIEQLNR